MLIDLPRLRDAKTQRYSSWDKTGRNSDAWIIEPGKSAVLADIQGPGCIRHIWMTQRDHYRQCLLRITWDDAKHPSVLCPLGDFFGLGHGIVNSYQSLLFTASTHHNNSFDMGCALNCYVPMPFAKRAVVELVNESREAHRQFFYVDYETYDKQSDGPMGYFHCEFRRENPFGGWGGEVIVNTPAANMVPNKARTAWENNYVILDTKGRGHYIGCNMSVTNFQGTWWGEGDDMIWVDGYKWPCDLHGTGSEDYFNQAWGMQDNAFLRNGSSVFEGNHLCGSGVALWSGGGGYQTSYVHHIENPVHFKKEIKVTIEHGHANHLCNEVSSAAYWYAVEPARAVDVPPVAKRMPVLRDNMGNWICSKKNQTTSRQIKPNHQMLASKARHKRSSRQVP